MIFWESWNESSPRQRALRLTGAPLLAATALWPGPIAAIAQESCGSYAVAVAPQPAGHPLSDNQVELFDGGSEVLSVNSSQPRTVFPSPRPGVAIVRSLGGLTSLLDVSTGTVTPFRSPEADQSRMLTDATSVRNAARSDFMLMAGTPGTVWLIDLIGGDAIDLSLLAGGGGPDMSALMSPDGTQVLLSGSGKASLFDLETLEPPRPLDTAPVLPGADFSPDGGSAIYAVSDGSGEATIRSLDLKTEKVTELGVVPDARFIHVTGGGPLLVESNAGLLAVRADGTVDTVDRATGPFSVLMHDPSGRYLLIGEDLGTTTAYRWIDTETGASVELPALKDMQPLAGSSQQTRTVFFVPGDNGGPGQPGAPYYVLEMATGNATAPLSQDSDDVWTATPAGDNEHRYVLVNTVRPGSGRTWLIDTETGAATLEGTSTGNLTAAVSPDGCQFATSIFDTLGEGRTSIVNVVSIVDGSAVGTIEDAILLGWAPTD